MTGPRRRRRSRVFIVALLACIAACGGGDGGPDELSGWRRSDVFGNFDAMLYDRVAVAADGERIVWLTRAPGLTDELAVSIWEGHDDGGPTRLELSPVDQPVIVPAAVAADAEGWTAVATVRDEPGGLTSSLVAWEGDTTGYVEPAVLEPPAGQLFTGDVTAARLNGRAAVVASTGEPPSGQGLPSPLDVFVWMSTGSGQWERVDLDVNGGSLFANRIVADGSRFVLAGVAANNRPVVWTSDEGVSWAEVEPNDLPDAVEGVELVVSLGDGSVLIGWMTVPDEQAVGLWRLTGSELRAMGPLVAADDVTRVHLYTAALRGEQLLVGG